MLDWLIALDKELLLFCNGIHYPWSDNFYWMVTSRMLNIFMVLPLLSIMMHRRKLVEAILLLLSIALVVLLCDQIASSVFKPLFMRLRPSHDPSITVLLVNGYRSGLYGFISSHAANSVGVAVFLALLFRHRWFTCAIAVWALLTSYSRIYLGVHFPGDVLVGAAVGATIGWGIYALYNKARCILLKKGLIADPQNPYRIDIYARYFATFIALLFVVLLVLSICVKQIF
ncbi:MAG: phosphatase PAP2 family protein [Bacteroidaceae bacterium]|nr:phosphatase PAP2 family protein [Bacteroidaceae bacterium]